MENASKALIIAGAILLAILIIGLGVFIYNQASNAIGNTGMDQLAIQQFNGQFESYEGRKSGSQVKQLLKTVISNNFTHSDDTSMMVWVNDSSLYPSDYTELPSINRPTKIGSGQMYNVSFQRNNKNGIIQGILISVVTEV